MKLPWPFVSKKTHLSVLENFGDVVITINIMFLLLEGTEVTSSILHKLNLKWRHDLEDLHDMKFPEHRAKFCPFIRSLYSDMGWLPKEKIENV